MEGGVRGVIPSVVLAYLETELQKLNDHEDVHLADFFHVIAGTSTGGLVSAMLATPDEHGRPVFAAKDIKDFYLDNSHKIFPPVSSLYEPVWKWIKPLFGPKYDGASVHQIIRETLKQKRLGDAITSVVIPTVDIKTQQPVIFSSYQIKKKPSINALLSDICIGTSAAPTYLPSHQFRHIDSEGKVTEYNLIDGGVIANNPTDIAITETLLDNDERNPRGSRRGLRLVVLSLGTGSSKVEDKYDATVSPDWGCIGWAKSMLTIWGNVDGKMADHRVTRLLQGLELEPHYLRIQATLTEKLSSMDDATPENMKNLVKAGEELLKEPSHRLNRETGKLEQHLGVTNEMALKELAVMLHNLRKSRMS